MNEQKFKTNMTFLQKYYGHQLDDLVYKVYYKKLAHISDENFDSCVNKITESSFRPTSKNPFPLIADFLKQVGESLDDRAINVTSHVKIAIKRHGAYESINFGDTALHYTIRGYGGWQEMCKWSNNDWKMKETAFINAYKAATKINTSEEQHLVGIHETNNLGRYSVAPPKKLFLNGINNIKEIEHKKGCKQIDNITDDLVKKLSVKE